MPELPEVETMVRGVRSCIDQTTIRRMEFCRCDRKPLQVSPDPRNFQRQVQNCTLVNVTRLAKRIVLNLAGGIASLAKSAEPDRHIVIEPRMTGLLLLTDPPTVEHRRICWHLQSPDNENRKLEFWDRRGLGTVRLLWPDDLQRLRDQLGTDALQMTARLWRIALQRTSRAIKVVLLDQTIVAGIGNLYASEILYRASIDPRRPASDLSDAQVRALQRATSTILETAIRYEGSTLGDGTYRNALNQQGDFQNHHQVYAQEGKPCPSCGAAIVRIVQAQRSTFYCPQCQK